MDWNVGAPRSRWRFNRPADALSHIDSLLDQLEGEAKTGADAAELEELRGRCNLAESKFKDAAKDFQAAIEHDPVQFSWYLELARLLRSKEIRKPDEADALIKKMVDDNEKLGRPHLYRFRYDSEFRPPAQSEHLEKALDLSPEDPEVLLTAGLVAEQKRDLATARTYLEKAHDLDHRNLEHHPGPGPSASGGPKADQAEATLRQAFKLKPTADLAFLLAETLILQGKIEGKDGANEFIEILRKQGLGDTYVQYLEGRLEVQQKNWDAAIPKLETARAVLAADPQISTQINLLMAECYANLGQPEKRLAALRRASEGGLGSEPARLMLAQALVESGQFDQALSILIPLADSRPELRPEIARLSFQETLRKLPDRAELGRGGTATTRGREGRQARGGRRLDAAPCRPRGGPGSPGRGPHAARGSPGQGTRRT